MAKSSGQKLKLLYLIRLLEQESSEEKPVSTARMIAYLEENGIHSERKSIYNDMESLREFGYDILQSANRRGGGYYLASRDFEVAELKMLVDVVQSSRFITSKKSRELISKLERMAGNHEAGSMQRQVHVVGRVKTENENIYYSIDSIHRAIQENRQISFCYMEWNLKKEMTARPGGTRIVSPWALIWKDENYYLAAYDANAGLLKHYRVDKMGAVTVLDQKREGRETYDQMDLVNYTKETFGMFGGESTPVTLEFADKMIGVIIDRFGRETPIRPAENGTFRIHTSVAVSGQFFGWMAGLGKEARILKPEHVREAYHSWLQEIIRRQE